MAKRGRKDKMERKSRQKMVGECHSIRQSANAMVFFSSFWVEKLQAEDRLHFKATRWGGEILAERQSRVASVALGELTSGAVRGFISVERGGAVAVAITT